MKRGFLHVFLPQMNAISTRVDCLLPVVVDEQQTWGACHCFDGLGDLLADGAGVIGFEAQLHRRNAQLHHFLDPLGIWDNGIEAQFVGAGRKA